jgi:LAO/AO transport system kinase
MPSAFSALRLLGQQGNPSHAALDTAAWTAQVMQLSALKADGIEEFWQQASRYRELQAGAGCLVTRRRAQDLAWLRERIDAGLRHAFDAHPAVRRALPELQRRVRRGELPPSVAARQLLADFLELRL